MNPLKLAIWASIAIVATEIPAQAAWNNVFQPTFFCRQRQSTSNYCQSCVPAPVRVAQAAPACNSCQTPVYAAPAPVYAAAPAPAPCNTCMSPPPTQSCTTNYIQRAYYEPVTTYESRSYYEPVTVNQTSYYYEAVTSYQTSYYPDPCSCGCGYVAKSCPVTSYQLKQQNCPVQTWVQRCAQVPVQSFRVAYKLEPQQTCCTTPAPSVAYSAPAPAPCPCPACPACPQQGGNNAAPIIEQPRPAPNGPNVGTNYRTNYTPTASNENNWKPIVNLGAIQPEGGDLVQGQVVRNDRTPTANTQVLFVNAATGSRHSIATNDAGRFNLSLAKGNYHVFLASGNGSPAYHSQVNVERNQANVLNLINN